MSSPSQSSSRPPRAHVTTSPITSTNAVRSAPATSTASLRIIVDMPDSVLRRGVLATLSSLNCDAYVTLRPPRRHDQFDLLITTKPRDLESTLVIDNQTSVGALVAAVIAISQHPLRQRHSAELSPREIEILVMAARGLSNSDIAERCFVAPNTVKTHLSRIYRKLNASDRASAVYTAVSSGIIPASELPIS